MEWKGILFHAIVDASDPVIVHALGCRVKYVRLVRRKLGGRERFSVQLICEGVPCWKPKHKIGNGEVGLDLGSSTVAVVGEEEAIPALFCEDLVRKHRAIRRLQRKLDRQRLANNLSNHLPDGRVKPRGPSGG